jgi:predicted transcriptional regulator
MVVQKDNLGLIFKALGEINRREILAFLTMMERPMGVMEIASRFNITFQAVSKHLKVMEQSGLVVRHIKGRQHKFTINPQPVREAQAWLNQYLSYWSRKED